MARRRDEYQPDEGGTEALLEAAMGVRRPKPPKPRKARSFIPGLPGVAPDKASPDYQRQLAAARKGMPPFREITFLEAIMYDNDAPGSPPRKRGVPRYQIAVKWTCAPPALVDVRDGGSMTSRLLPLAPREQARDNWNRRGKKQGQYRIEPEERIVIDALMGHAQIGDSMKDGRPASLLGCLRNRFDAGTIRHSQFGLVLWYPDGTGGWLPSLMIVRAFPQMEPLITRDPQTGEPRAHLDMQPGRGKKVLAHASHCGDHFHQYLRPPWLDRLVAENLAAMEKPQAAPE